MTHKGPVRYMETCGFGETEALFHWVKLSSFSGSGRYSRNDPERKPRGAKDAGF